MDGDDYTLTSIAGATSSSRGVFYNSNITSIEIPSTIESIGNYAFYYCRNLTEINYNALSLTDLSSDNWVFSYAGNDGNGITVNFGEGIKSIPAYLFCPYSSTSASPNITYINFSSTITSIGSYAFSGCSGLTTINFPTNLKSIGASAFENCDRLASLTIPSSVTSIDANAFYNCDSLTNIIIDSKNIYSAARSASNCGYILQNARTVRVLASIDDGSNTYLNNNFTKTTDGEYNVYTKN